MQPNKYNIYSCILKACASIPDLAQGKAVHEHMLKSEAEVDVIVGSSLLDMYVKCGDFQPVKFSRVCQRAVYTTTSCLQVWPSTL